MPPSEIEWEVIRLERENDILVHLLRDTLDYADACKGDVTSAELLRRLRDTFHELHNMRREFRRRGRTRADDEEDVSDNSQMEPPPKPYQPLPNESSRTSNIPPLEKEK